MSNILVEPAVTRAIAFIDGQNLFHAAKEAFGYHYPNFDVQKLSESICAPRGWKLVGSRFYTGVPDPSDNPFWSHFWAGKLASMGSKGTAVFARPLRQLIATTRKLPRPDSSEA
jgi:hypothetical protein